MSWRRSVFNEGNNLALNSLKWINCSKSQRQIFYFQEKKLYQFSFLSKKNDISLALLISKETGLIEAEALYWCCCGLCKGILQFWVYCLLAYIFFQIKKGGERKRDRRGFSFYEWWVAGWMGAATVGRRWVLWKLYPPHHGRILNEEKNPQKIKMKYV